MKEILFILMMTSLKKVAYLGDPLPIRKGYNLNLREVEV